MTVAAAELSGAHDERDRRRRNLRLAMLLGLVAAAFYGGFILMHWR
ncbi:MAG TPA: hypothetical protein VMH34_02205 [Gammaproteobacteria bacterium]|nr:hypothetical protein [Gammaproteobacteria bacterium]